MIENLERLYFIAKCLVINKENKILVLKRSNYKKNGTQDLWDLPGGNVEKYEDVNDSIKREVEEEIGIKLNSTQVFAINSSKSKRSDAQLIMTLFYSKDYDKTQKIILSHEHKNYKWISFQELDNHDFYLNDKCIEEIKKLFMGKGYCF